MLLFLQDLKALQQLHKAKINVSHDDHHSNIATVLLGDQRSQDEDSLGEATEANVVKALEQKYDAIRDKLLIEVRSWRSRQFWIVEKDGAIFICRLEKYSDRMNE